MGIYRTLIGMAALALMLSAGIKIETESVLWNPPWPLRLAMAGTGVFVAIGATFIGVPRKMSDCIPGTHVGRE